MTAHRVRIVNVTPTPKGAACPEFMKWLFERLDKTPEAVQSDWISARFLEIR